MTWQRAAEKRTPLPHNLRKPQIAAAIAEAQAERADRLKIDADTVLQEIAKLAYVNMRDFIRLTPDGDAYVNLSNLTREQAAALAEVTIEDFVDGRGEDARNVRRVKIKLADKKGSLELLGKHLGLFTERIEAKHSFDGVIGIRVNLPKGEDEPA